MKKEKHKKCFSVLSIPIFTEIEWITWSQCDWNELSSFEYVFIGNIYAFTNLFNVIIAYQFFNLHNECETDKKTNKKRHHIYTRSVSFVNDAADKNKKKKHRFWKRVTYTDISIEQFVYTSVDIGNLFFPHFVFSFEIRFSRESVERQFTDHFIHVK